MALWLFACDSSEVVLSDKCTVEIENINPLPLTAGQEATIIATPMSEPWDSRITFDNVSVLASNLERLNCEACDSCRLRYECIDCFDCDSCDSICKSTCKEQLTFEVPNELTGAYQLYLINRFGQSAPMNIVVEATRQDTGLNDSGLE